MKYPLIFLILLLNEITFAQSEFPDFLHGTWKMENQEVYEHWDKLNENTMKGFSYKVRDKKMIISEYLDISKKENEIIYTATVLYQNQGRGVNFKLTKIDSTFTFENPDHDFPKRIAYQKLTDTELRVKVSGGEKKSFSYKMRKQIETSGRDTTYQNPNYDSELARQLGGDKYGMKSYIMIILKTGNNKSTDQSFINDCFKGHLDNINRLVEENKLIVAGPFGKNDKSYRGIFILNVTTFEEAEKLMQTDPAIKEGFLDIEFYNWYGSAALPEYLKASDNIWKVKP